MILNEDLTEEQAKKKLGEYQLIPVSELKHYKNNRKKHSKAQVARLAKLIARLGFRDPLKVDGDTMEVIAGNGTLMAVKLLGWQSVHCSVQSFQSEEERYAFSTSHNAISMWEDSVIEKDKIHHDMPDMTPFDTDLLGFPEWRFEPVSGMSPDEDQKKLKFITCPNCNEEFEDKQAKQKRTA